MTKIKQRFYEKFEPQPSGCWEWTACSNGYGRFNIFGQTRYAHIVSWFIHKGEWPTLFVCHTCDNPICVNPEHLFEGTNADNMADAARKGHMGRPRKFHRREEARQLYAQGLSQRKIAKLLGTTHSTISECCRFAHEPRK